MILKYHIEVAEKIEDDILIMPEKEVTELTNNIKEALTRWLELGSFNLAEPIKVEFDLEEER